MFDRVAIIETIDRAYEARRFCEACGVPTILRNDGDTVVLECSAAADQGVLARISAFLMPHTRRVVIDLLEGIAA